ncbi:MAG TPA: hypothetical protein VK548_29450 [Candidatus Acidoferrum sp.]|nr:hypothetical protein [Candidatus Acidoferrum sp.]
MKRHDESGRGRAGPRIGLSRPMWRALTVLLVAGLAGLAGLVGVADAEVPTAGDIAACNREARDQRAGGAASPTSKDETGAAAARKASDGQPTHSPDAQVHGLDADGAPDATYRASYRVCMRRRGF